MRRQAQPPELMEKSPNSMYLSQLYNTATHYSEFTMAKREGRSRRMLLTDPTFLDGSVLKEETMSISNISELANDVPCVQCLSVFTERLLALARRSYSPG